MPIRTWDEMVRDKYVPIKKYKTIIRGGYVTKVPVEDTPIPIEGVLAALLFAYCAVRVARLITRNVSNGEGCIVIGIR